MKKAVILFSGGLDSTTTLAIAKAQGFQCHAISFRYGQRHHHEITMAREIAGQIGVKNHIILDIPLTEIGGSALTGKIAVPKNRLKQKQDQTVPVTYVPARNTIFLAYALAWAETLNAFDLFIGVNALDYSGYPDCRPEYIEAFEYMANLATKAGVEGKNFSVRTPLIHMTKAQIIQKGMTLGVDYRLTHSCYDPDERGRACGHCDSCLLRKKGFREAGVPDPTRYIEDQQAV
ncbi:7-cyano-7-deazaguanine synthase QueC [bacterium]|nr:7-cyano-7-deazaguanine synthase QueC [bacterium]